MNKKILIGIPPERHVILALDEFNGLNNQGYSCEHVTYTNNKWSANFLSRVYGLLRNVYKVIHRLRKQKPDILYLNSRFDTLGTVRDCISISLIRVLYRRKLKIVIKSHGSELEILNKGSFFYDNIIIPALISKVDAWLFLSEDEKEDMIRYFPHLEKKVFVTFNIINAERSVKSKEFQKNHNLEEDVFKFLFVGRMIRDKGVFTILESIAKFEQYEECLFLMVGNGLELEKLKVRAKDLKIVKYVLFTGFVPEEECDHFFANTDAFILPSLDEGFAMALFKSVVSGLPVITTKIRAAKDQLKAPDNCLWVKEESAESTAKALTEMYTNSSLREKMYLNNRKLGVKYNQEMVSKQMHEIFKVVATSEKSTISDLEIKA